MNWNMNPNRCITGGPLGPPEERKLVLSVFKALVVVVESLSLFKMRQGSTSTSAGQDKEVVDDELLELSAASAAYIVRIAGSFDLPYEKHLLPVVARLLSSTIRSTAVADGLPKKLRMPLADGLLELIAGGRNWQRGLFAGGAGAVEYNDEHVWDDLRSDKFDMDHVLLPALRALGQTVLAFTFSSTPPSAEGEGVRVGEGVGDVEIESGSPLADVGDDAAVNTYSVYVLAVRLMAWLRESTSSNGIMSLRPDVLKAVLDIFEAVELYLGASGRREAAVLSAVQELR